jgi:hypothetical protein
MSLRAFIRDHQEDIIVEFAAFAKTLMRVGAEMTDKELRDHAKDLLTALDEDMAIAQTSEKQWRKSRGHVSANIMRVSGRLHADGRIEHGFAFEAVLAEFRARERF